MGKKVFYCGPGLDFHNFEKKIRQKIGADNIYHASDFPNMPIAQLCPNNPPNRPQCWVLHGPGDVESRLGIPYSDIILVIYDKKEIKEIAKIESQLCKIESQPCAVVYDTYFMEHIDSYIFSYFKNNEEEIIKPNRFKIMEI